MRHHMQDAELNAVIVRGLVAPVPQWFAKIFTQRKGTPDLWVTVPLCYDCEGLIILTERLRN